MQWFVNEIKAECELNTTTSEVKIEKFDYQLYYDEMNEGTIPNFKKEKNIIKRGNSQNTRIECSDCDQTFCYESGLNMHIRNVHLKAVENVTIKLTINRTP